MRMLLLLGGVVGLKVLETSAGPPGNSCDSACKATLFSRAASQPKAARPQNHTLSRVSSLRLALSRTTYRQIAS